MLGSLVACGGGETKTASTPANDGTSAAETTAETVKTDGLPDTDMKGFSLNLLHDDGTSVSWVISTLVVEEETGEFINDAIYARNMYIEERFNCKFNAVGAPNVNSVIEGIVTSGDSTYDFIMQTGSNIMGKIALIDNLHKIPHIRLGEDYWNPNATNAFSIGDKQLAICGNFSLSYLCGLNGIAFNKNLWDDLQIKDDPYTLAREGKWTIDKFFELCEKGVADLNGDGKMTVDDDRYGLATTVRGFMNALSVGAGFTVVGKDKDNMPFFNLDGNEAMVNYFLKLLNETISNPYVLGNSYTTTVHTGGDANFKTGHALMNITSVKGISGMREMEDDFGVVPLPKADEKQERYYSNSSAGEVTTLPLSADPSRFEYTGMLMEALAFRSETVLLDAFKEVCLKSKYARDEEMGEMLDIMFRTVTFDQGFVLFTNQFYNKLVENTFWTKNVAIASTIASMKDSINGHLTSAMESAATMEG